MIDDRWLARAIQWAADQAQPLPSPIDAPMQLKSSEPSERARASIVLSAQAYELPQKRHAAKFRLANSCRSMAVEARRADNRALERDWLVVACRLYADLSSGEPEKFKASLEGCSSTLAQMGITDWQGHDPVARPDAVSPADGATPAAVAEQAVDHGSTREVPLIAAVPPPAAVPHDEPQETLTDDDERANATRGEATRPYGEPATLPHVDAADTPVPATEPAGYEDDGATPFAEAAPDSATSASRADPQAESRRLLGIITLPPADAADRLTDDLSSDFERDTELPAYARSWVGSEDLVAALDAFKEYLREQIERAPVAWTHLRATVDDDFVALGQLLGESGVPVVPEDMRLRAKDARRLALAHEPNTRMETLVRRRWLVAGLWNHALWKAPYGWPTNEPQVVSDLMGYMTTVQIARRFIDEERELLLSLCELVVRLASGLEPPDRHPQVLRWVRSVVGTYLVIGGPEPYLPSISKKHPALVGERLTPTGPGVGVYDTGTEVRDRWAATLLDTWRSQDAERTSGAAFALATVCGWDRDVLTFALACVFVAQRDPDLEAQSFWERDVLSVIEGASPIRIASNPWKPEGSTAEKAHAVTSEASGRLRIPSPVLRALTAQLTEEGWSTTVQGELFRGRRVPTYLLVNQYGAFGVLKLDYADRVRREAVNFTEFARRRIHPNYRPSECRTGTYRMFVGEHPEPLQAILTSYVFDEEETPTTLSDWLRDADPATIELFLRRFFLRVLRPWLAHVTRRVIDLRMSYPLLRPRPAEHDEHAPTLTARTELPRLASDEVVAALGFRAEWTQRDFADMREALLHVDGLQEIDIPVGLINPLWLVAELAEMGDGDLVECLYSTGNPVSAFSSLQTICHGDLHADNVLCSGGADGGLPRPVLIDFETAHEGHVCRDFARLEAHLLCQNFAWSSAAASALAAWLAVGLAGGVYEPPDIDSDDPDVACSSRRYAYAAGDGQEVWTGALAFGSAGA